MFPGVDGFHWTFGHIVFLLLFFAVAVTIAAIVVSAALHTARDFRTHRAIQLCWQAGFADLPESERRCRHELAGRVISRTCDNAFDCRHCEKYSQYAVLPATGNVGSLGLDYPDDRYYHRGHTWLKCESDGTVTIGLDDVATHLIGNPDSLRMPEVGEELELNQPAWEIQKNRREIQVRAPLEGTVVEVGGPKQGWYLRLRPRLDVHDPLTLRHLLRGAEVHGWISRELERLQLQLRPAGTPPTLADGGVLMLDLMNAIADADWDTILAATFLQP